MATSSSSIDIDELIERYIDEHGWEQDKAHCQNTSQAVRRLVEALVETGSINEAATRTVYNLCQNDDAFSPANKKERIDDLDIVADAKRDIKERIEEGAGIVGAGTYSVPVGGNEEAVFNLFSTAINSDDRDEIDAAIELSDVNMPEGEDLVGHSCDRPGWLCPTRKCRTYLGRTDIASITIQRVSEIGFLSW